MRHFVMAALAAITLANVATAAEAATQVRDHRRPEAQVRDHRRPSPPPSVNRPGDGANGGVTVTSRPRPKKQKACLLGIACTTNETIVGIADKTIPRPVGLR